jgi:hypothetical protein
MHPAYTVYRAVNGSVPAQEDQGLQFSVVPVITEENSCGLDLPIMSLTGVFSLSVLSCNSTQYGANQF